MTDEVGVVLWPNLQACRLVLRGFSDVFEEVSVDFTQPALRAPIRNSGDVFSHAAARRGRGASVAGRVARSGRVKVHWKGLAPRG